MTSASFTYWEDGGVWVGFLDEHPDFLTHGESLADLIKHLHDLRQDLDAGVTPPRGAKPVSCADQPWSPHSKLRDAELPTAAPVPKFACPKCKRAILNRAYQKCEHCGADLPPELLFTKHELATNWDEQFMDPYETGKVWDEYRGCWTKINPPALAPYSKKNPYVKRQP